LKVASKAVTSEGFEVKYEEGVKMKIHLEEIIGYLAVRFTGAGTVEEAWRQFESIAEHCERANKNKLLLDFTEAQTEISIADRYFFGERAKIFAGQTSKVATVGRPDQFDHRRFGETVARNRWVNFRVFTNTEDAARWLLE
jgi:hypothetical protein